MQDEEDVRAYAAWGAICNREGWDSQTQITLLEAFIRNHFLLPEFARFAMRATEHSRAMED